MTDQIWTRRKGEAPDSYEAFKTYLYMGKDRTLEKVREASGRTRASVEALSVQQDWIERSRAYDSYIVTANVDGMVHALAESRDKNLALMDKLRGLLDSRLDTFIETRQDPTIRWTQACMAMAKIEANSLAMGKEDKASERIERIEELVERALREPVET